MCYETEKVNKQTKRDGERKRSNRVRSKKIETLKDIMNVTRKREIKKKERKQEWRLGLEKAKEIKKKIVKKIKCEKGRECISDGHSQVGRIFEFVESW